MERIFLGRYEPIRLLGEGSMGRVYLAKQPDMERQVVVKVMHEHLAQDPAFRERFKRETLLMAKLQHPYAVALYDASLDDPQGPCIIIEHVRGVLLDALLKKNKGKLGPARVNRLLSQMCEVLQTAHDLGITHRDLRPANIMVLESDTPYEKIKVMDFGLATLNSSADQATGSSESTAGDPCYMSPEQAKGEIVDCRSDVYSLGVILFHLLTGEVPFPNKSAADTLKAHANEKPPAFIKIKGAHNIPPGVEAVVQSCLVKNPAQRPESAHELAENYQWAAMQECSGMSDLTATTMTTAKETIRTKPLPEDVQKELDPNAIVFKMQASMSLSIAAYKMRGFVNDKGGQLLESIPGKIRVRLGDEGTYYEIPKGFLAMICMQRYTGSIEVHLYLRRADVKRADMQFITVLMRSAAGSPANDERWRSRCDLIYADLRGYLMGQDMSDAPAPEIAFANS